MNSELIKIRIKSFGYELLGLGISGLAGFLMSDGVRDLISQHFGSTLTASLIVMAVSGLAKHLHNIKLAKQLGKLGSTEDRPQYI